MFLGVKNRSLGQIVFLHQKFKPRPLLQLSMQIMISHNCREESVSEIKQV